MPACPNAPLGGIAISPQPLTNLVSNGPDLRVPFPDSSVRTLKKQQLLFTTLILFFNGGLSLKSHHYGKYSFPFKVQLYTMPPLFPCHLKEI